ncbi:protein-tyrosine phosphatase-like protein [Phascolomyces articulosus]|uniref:Protein-tyrosine phosphatase-like protein n=1 Tax=Phascolomyces articulosus TaxID=60185 RepID=A0AAD5P7S4_9FUNG|nr:protein-tyrosine phosphatase-like protein [Phascolomyces articulosus]
MTVRTIVSENRHRYIDAKASINLDLSYVTERIIAMSYPSEGWEGFLMIDTGQQIIKRSEKRYHEQVFSFSAATYGFNDHQAPPFDLLIQFCKDAGKWLTDPKHVVAIHCKAGKGRTGTAIAALLLYTHQVVNSDAAMRLYNIKRTKDGRGITIPSQIRYVKYFEKWVHFTEINNGPIIEPSVNRGDSCAISIYKVIIHGIPSAYKNITGGWVDLSISDYEATLYNRNQTNCKVTTKDDTIVLEMPYVRVENDFKLEFFVKSLYIFKKKLCRFWLNTRFIVPDNSDATKTFKLTKPEIDGAANDTQHQQFPSNFAIEIEFDINFD